MAGALTDPTRAPVAFGRRAVPQLFGELQRAEAAARLRALTSLCDLVHEPERLYQAVTGGKSSEGHREVRPLHRGVQFQGNQGKKGEAVKLCWTSRLLKTIKHNVRTSGVSLAVIGVFEGGTWGGTGPL